MLAFGSSFHGSEIATYFGFDLWFGVALGQVTRSTECLIRGSAGRREPRPIHHKHEFRLHNATFSHSAPLQTFLCIVVCGTEHSTQVPLFPRRSRWLLREVAYPIFYK
jgi:hypothetical protein